MPLITGWKFNLPFSAENFSCLCPCSGEGDFFWRSNYCRQHRPWFNPVVDCRLVVVVVVSLSDAGVDVVVQIAEDASCLLCFTPGTVSANWVFSQWEKLFKTKTSDSFDEKELAHRGRKRAKKVCASSLHLIKPASPIYILLPDPFHPIWDPRGQHKIAGAA